MYGLFVSGDEIRYLLVLIIKLLLIKLIKTKILEFSEFSGQLPLSIFLDGNCCTKLEIFNYVSGRESEKVNANLPVIIFVSKF